MFENIMWVVGVVVVGAIFLRFWHPTAFGRFSRLASDKMSAASKKAADSDPVARLQGSIDADSAALRRAEIAVGNARGKIKTYERQEQTLMAERAQAENRIKSLPDGDAQALAYARRIAETDRKLTAIRQGLDEARRVEKQEHQAVASSRAKIDAAKSEAEVLKLKIEVKQETLSLKNTEVHESSIDEALEAARRHAESLDGQAEVLSENQPEVDLAQDQLDDEAQRILESVRSQR